MGVLIKKPRVNFVLKSSRDFAVSTSLGRLFNE